jgi:hypothetical protein
MTTSDQGPSPASPPSCVQCGAPAPPRAAGATPPDDTDETVTHCEWCGAEYPVPEHG